MSSSARRGRSALVVVVALACAHASAASRAPAKLTDPLVGLTFDVAHVHFDVLPSMPPAVTEGTDGPLYLFASAKDSDSTVDVAGSFEREYEDCGRPTCPYTVTGSGFGVVVRITRGHAKALGTADLLSGPPGHHAPLDDALVDRLWQDAGRRFAKAFGGASKLRAAMRAQNIKPESVSPAFWRGAGN